MRANSLYEIVLLHYSSGIGRPTQYHDGRYTIHPSRTDVCQRIFGTD